MADAESEPLQFEEAESGAGAGPAPCAGCKRLLDQQYFEVGGQVVCASCRDAVLASLDRGTPGLRFGRSVGLGLVAAALGSALYYAIRAATGYELGLIGVVVGLLVGGGVKRGSFGRGGGRYQALAMVLTYCAIVTTYLPMVTQGMRGAFKQAGENASTAAAVPAPAPPAALPLGGAEPSMVPKTAPPNNVARPVDLPVWLRVVATLLFYAVAFALACAMPFLAFDPMGLAIIAFSLWEAWKLNRRVPIVVRGPFQVVRTDAEPDGACEPTVAAAEP